MDLKPGDFYLGTRIDDESGESTAERLIYDSSDLTTHGVIVGMTGSGKTGLGIDMLEEALLNRIPCLIIDPKGDMGNLLLSFPEFEPEQFRPWIDEAEAAKAGITPDELANEKATLWKKGLEIAGISGERLEALNDNSEITIYTPGSGAGVPLNVLGSLAAPDIDWDSEAEIARDEIEGLVSSLLLLADIEADPVSDPRHILLATIIEHHWAAGTDLDLAALVGQIPKPPLRKLGVFELDTFFPEKDRMALAMKLNGLLASPSFSSWLEGVPLDIDEMLTGGDKTKAAVVYLAHLSETERQFMVTLLLSRMITWFRGQSGTSDLRAMIYMDEVFGYVPPVKEPPTKKAILTILKQARAFGVGMVLSTQNPVDLDYKALSNAGTWMIGRLQTERDKLRLLEGLNAASGSVDVGEYDNLISALDKRQFILHTTDGSQPARFATRWAQSYLAGPLTRDQVGTLMEDPRKLAMGSVAATTSSDQAIESEAEAPSTALEPTSDDDVVPVMPPVADKVATRFVDPGAPWLETIGASPMGGEHVIAAAATVQLLYDDRASGLNHQETYEVVIYPLDAILKGENVIAVDHDERDFMTEPSPGTAFEIPVSPVDEAGFWSGLEKDLKSFLVANKKVTILKNAELGIYSRVGETEAEFAERSQIAADDAADAEMAKLKDKYKTKIDRVKGQIATAESRVHELSSKAEAKKQEEMMTGVGDLLGGLLGGRKASTTIGKAASRRTATRNAEARAEAAAQALDDKTAGLASLEYELEDDVTEIVARHQNMIENTEEVEIGLEASDVRVAEIKAIWVPVG